MVYTKIVPIKHDIDYTPGKGGLDQHSRYITGIMATKELKGNLTLYLLNNPTEGIEIPKDCFVTGGIYNFAIAKIKYSDENDSCSIIGCIENPVRLT
ncbi:MAG: hypothetical protein WC979_02010 [Candidatus Pacearchaeota archaeon]|jgi:hypothetical protein|nr:hypothetical protein [Clostridia bacterium]